MNETTGSAARQLRWIGWSGLVLGGISSVLSVAQSLFFLTESPLRTVGAHSALPSNFHSIVFGLGAGAIALDSFYVALVGGACLFPRKAGAVGAISGGLITLLLSFLAPFALTGFAGFALPIWLVGALVLFDSMLVRFAGAYLIVLGLAVRSQGTDPAAIGWRRWLSIPMVQALGIWTASLGVVAALRPATLIGQIEADIARSAVTSGADTLEVRSGVVRAFALVPRDTSVVLVGFGDGEPTLERFGGDSPRKRLWQVPLPTGRLDYDEPISLAVSHDGKRIAVMTERRTAIVDGDNGQLVREVDQCDEIVRGRGDHALAFSPDSRTLAVGQGSLCLGSVDSLEVDVRIPRSETDSKQVRNLVFSPNGKQLWLAFNNTVECWDIAEGKRMISIASGSSQFALSHDGRRVATLSEYGRGERSIEAWDAASGEKLWQADNPGDSTLMGPMAYLPDNRHVVVLGLHTFFVIDPETGRFREMGPSYQGLAVSVLRNFVVFSASAAAGDSTPTMQFIQVPELFTRRAREGTTKN